MKKLLLIFFFIASSMFLVGCGNVSEPVQQEEKESNVLQNVFVDTSTLDEECCEKDIDHVLGAGVADKKIKTKATRQPTLNNKFTKSSLDIESESLPSEPYYELITKNVSGVEMTDYEFDQAVAEYKSLALNNELLTGMPGTDQSGTTDIKLITGLFESYKIDCNVSQIEGAPEQTGNMLYDLLSLIDDGC